MNPISVCNYPQFYQSYNFHQMNRQSKLSLFSDNYVYDLNRKTSTNQLNRKIITPRYYPPSSKRESNKSFQFFNTKSSHEKSMQRQTQDEQTMSLTTDDQLLQIFQMSKQIANITSNNSISKQQYKRVQQKTGNNQLSQKMHHLFNLYIKEQILKHYCLKQQWKIQRKILEKFVIPTFDLLAISKDKISNMFQPFLQKLTSKYILQTELDTYSRLEGEQLLIEITEVWVTIKQAQIQLKRIIRSDIKQFKYKFCKSLEGKQVLDRTALYNSFFKISKDIQMVNLIKIFIFCFKVQGEAYQELLEDWVTQY